MDKLDNTPSVVNIGTSGETRIARPLPKTFSHLFYPQNLEPLAITQLGRRKHLRLGSPQYPSTLPRQGGAAPFFYILQRGWTLLINTISVEGGIGLQKKWKEIPNQEQNQENLKGVQEQNSFISSFVILLLFFGSYTAA